MGRKKVTGFVIPGSWDEADNYLRQIGELKIEREVKMARAQLEINEIKEKVKTDCAPLDAETERLEHGLKAFCDSECAKKEYKSRMLTFGGVFYRKVTVLKNLKGVKWAQVADRLEEQGLKQYLEIKTSVRRDDLKASSLGKTALAELGVERATERPFKYEINEEKFERVDTTDAPPAGRAAAAGA